MRMKWAWDMRRIRTPPRKNQLANSRLRSEALIEMDVAMWT
jgi:hypothetical protein